ncbi:unnamed protein product [Acanthoscelides obtectus]|uniref:Uncharacterized protein n=1 Tax=Acanthoscelides obtectus TaxID=200917 RepID=A0A9P0KXY3_ACAOB|nr:unnamed protein product [Acanthoscelides obtectus]CAK1654562.1 hypothetical protein AOBTE_LOCUS18676 [Acanthoscelides obtectus]
MILIDEGARNTVPNKTSDYPNVSEDWIQYNKEENIYQLTQQTVDFSALENNVRFNEANEYAVNNILLPGGRPSPVTDRSSSNGIGLNDKESMILIDEGARNTVPNKTSDFTNVSEDGIQYNKEENIYQLTQQTVDFSALENNVRLNDANEYDINNILLPEGRPSPVTDRSSSNGIGLNDKESMILIDEGARNTVPNKTSDFPNVTEDWIQYNKEENIYQLNIPAEAYANVVLIPSEESMTTENSVSPLPLSPEPSASIPSTTESDRKKVIRTVTPPKIQKRIAKPKEITAIPTRKNSRTRVVAPKNKEISHKVEKPKETKNAPKRSAEDLLQSPPSEVARISKGDMPSLSLGLTTQIDANLEMAKLVEEFSPRSEGKVHAVPTKLPYHERPRKSPVGKPATESIKENLNAVPHKIPNDGADKRNVPEFDRNATNQNNLSIDSAKLNFPSCLPVDIQAYVNIPYMGESNSMNDARTATPPKIEKRIAKPKEIPAGPTRKNIRTRVVAPKKKDTSHKVEENKEAKNALKRSADGLLQPPPSKVARIAKEASLNLSLTTQIDGKLELPKLVEEFSPRSEGKVPAVPTKIPCHERPCKSPSKTLKKRIAKPIDTPMVPTRKYSRTPVFTPKRERPSCKVEESKETKNELKRAAGGTLQPPPSKFAKVMSEASQIETKLELNNLIEEYSPRSEGKVPVVPKKLLCNGRRCESPVRKPATESVQENFNSVSYRIPKIGRGNKNVQNSDGSAPSQIKANIDLPRSEGKVPAAPTKILSNGRNRESPVGKPAAESIKENLNSAPYKIPKISAGSKNVPKSDRSAPSQIKANIDLPRSEGKVPAVQTKILSNGRNRECPVGKPAAESIKENLNSVPYKIPKIGAGSRNVPKSDRSAPSQAKANTDLAKLIEQTEKITPRNKHSGPMQKRATSSSQVSVARGHTTKPLSNNTTNNSDYPHDNRDSSRNPRSTNSSSSSAHHSQSYYP